MWGKAGGGQKSSANENFVVFCLVDLWEQIFNP